MVAVLKSALLLAALSGVAATTQLTPAQVAWYRAELTGAAPQAVEPAPSPDALMEAIVQWKRLRQSSSYPFADYASFLAAHPGWPDEKGMRRSAEHALTVAPASPQAIVAYFKRYPPLSGGSEVAYAQALAVTGDPVAAQAAARTAWTEDLLSPSDESTLLTSFGSNFRPADQDKRMDRLLWAQQTAAATRQLALTSPGSQPVFAARLAYLANAPDADTIGGQIAGPGRMDPGFIAARATWLTDNRQVAAARAYLAEPHQLSSRPGSVAAWFRLLRDNARGAEADRRYDIAYGIAHQVDDAYAPGTDLAARPYAEKDAYTDLVWMAGNDALHHLGRPRDAIAMFERYSRPFPTPQTRSKGFYWAGRAAEAAGDTAQANGFFAQGSAFTDSFYGQLSAEHLGRDLEPPLAPELGATPPAERDAYYARETVRAAEMLGTIDDHADQTAFIRQIAINATSDTDHRLSLQLSRALARPDLAVMIEHSALQNGLGDYVAAGYPIVAVPPTQDANWTIIHAVARQESQFDRAAESRAGALGLMQLMPGTARSLSQRMGLPYSQSALTDDPSYNATLGGTYIQTLFGTYGSWPLAVAAYNAGPGNVNRWLAANGDPRTGAIDMVDWIEAIPIHETRSYVQRVLENAVVYDLLNPEHALSHPPARLDWYLDRRPR